MGPGMFGRRGTEHMPSVVAAATAAASSSFQQLALHGAPAVGAASRAPLLLPLRRLRRAWLHFALPATFLLAGLLRCGAVLGGIYMLVALAFAAVSGVRRGPPCAKARHVYGVLTVLFVLIFLCAAALEICCAINDDLSVVPRWVGIGGPLVGSSAQDKTCPDILNVLPEALLLAVSFLNWILSKHNADSGVPSSEWLLLPITPGLKTRTALVCALLVTIPALDYNLFASVYYIAVIILAVLVATAPTTKAHAHCVILALRRGVMFMSFMHVVVFWTCAVPAVAKQLATHHLGMLGVQIDTWNLVQCMCAFLLLQSLIYLPKQVADIIVEHVDQGAAAAGQGGHLASNVASAAAMDVQPDDSSGSQDCASSWRLNFVEREPADSPLVSSVAGAFTISFLRAVHYCRQSSLLPMFSFLVWPALWPSLAALPLLFLGFALMHRPSRGPPIWLLGLALLYEALSGITLYVFTVICHAMKLPYSKVPFEYTWKERIGLQSLLRLHHGGKPAEVWQFALASGQLFCIFVLALGIHLLRRKPPALLLQAMATGSFTQLRPRGDSPSGTASPNVPADSGGGGDGGDRGRGDSWDGCMSSVMRSLGTYSPTQAMERGVSLGSNEGPNLAERMTIRESTVYSLLEWIRRCSILLFRVASVWFLLLVVLADWASLSLIMLGYVFWLVYLAIRGLRQVGPMWDVLEGSAASWRALVVYSQAVSLATFLWQILATYDLAFVGLWRAQRQYTAIFFPHLAVGVFAALQAWAIDDSGNQRLQCMRKVSSAPARLCQNLGPYVVMGLMMFAIVAPKPTAPDFLLHLILFIMIVAKEQFSGGQGHRLFAFGACLCAVLLPLRYFIMIPAVQDWLEQRLPQDQNQALWDCLALAASTALRSKLMAMAVCMLVCSYLHVLAKLTEAVPFVERWPILARRLANMSKRSKCVLVFVAFFPLLAPAAAIRGLLIGMLCFLVRLRQWSLVSPFMSLYSMCLLLLQYVYRLDVVRVVLEWCLQLKIAPISHAQAEYWGLTWTPRLIDSEMFLLLFGIAQSGIQRCVESTRVDQATGPTTESQGPGSALKMAPWLMPLVVVYRAQLGGMLLLAVAMYRGSAWSAVMVATVLAFASTTSSTRALHPSHSFRWLRVMQLMLVLSLLYQWTYSMWLPPGLLARPDPESFDIPVVCDMFNSQSLVETEGGHCDDALLPNCATQRSRCQSDWASWLGLDMPTAIERTFLEYFTLFCICMLMKASNNPQDLDASLAYLAERGSPELRADADPCEALNGASAPGSAVGSDDPRLSASATEEQRAHWMSAGGTRHLGTKIGQARVAHIFSAAALWISMLGAFTAQPVTNAITAAYMLLLFGHLVVMFSQVLDEQVTRSRRVSLVKAIRSFNIVVVALSVVFQIPSAPCPFVLDVRNSAVNMTTNFLSFGQCHHLEDTGSTIGVHQNLLGLLMQSAGVQKDHGPFTLSEADCWNVLVFITSWLFSLVNWHWRKELMMDLQEKFFMLRRQEVWYAQYLAELCRVELGKWDTKRGMLLLKLDQLTKHLNELREVWSNRRPGFDRHYEARREHEARVVNMCLSTGAEQAVVEAVLLEFDTAVVMLDEGAERDFPPNVVKVLDRLAHRHLTHCEMQRLRIITARQRDAWKEELLSRCKLLMLLSDDAAIGGQLGLGWHLSAALDNVSICVPSKDAAVVGRGPSTEHSAGARSVSDIQWELDTARETATPTWDAETSAFQGKGEEPGLEHVRKEKGEDPVLEPARKPGDQEIDDEDEASSHCPKINSQHARRSVVTLDGATDGEAASSWVSLVRKWCCNLCIKAIDDLLFARPDHITLSWHRRRDGFLFLVLKALASQTHGLLVATAAFQFVCYQSVLSAGTVVVAILSLMDFPHTHPFVYRGLQWYTFAVIIAKMIYQLPVFCETGSVSLMGCVAPDPTLTSGVSGWVALGLLKVYYGGDSWTPSFSSLWQGVFADVLVCAMIFLHVHVLAEGGRAGNPTAVCKTLALAGFRQSGPRGRPVQGLAIPGLADRTEASGVDDAEHEPDHQGWQTAVREWFVDCLVGTSNLRKPPMDLYTYRFTLALCCLTILILFWNELAGSGQSFTASLTSNSFSGKMVMCVVGFLIMLVLDRALYTWYTQDRHHVSGDATPERLNRGFSSIGPTVGAAEQSARMWATTLQKVLLVTQLILLHAVIIQQALVKPDVSMTGSPMLMVFYALYISFLGLTSRQLKFDVVVVQGGLTFTHSTSFVSWLAFKIYRVIPFVEELRVLTDWTVTITSLQFFMWMKVEDAHQNLYNTWCDMEYRMSTKFAEKRPQREKCLQGGLLLVGLLILIVGPLIFFSELNFFLEENNIVAGSLQAGIKVQTSSGPKSMQFYQSSQLTLQARGSADDAAFFQQRHPEVNQPITLQFAAFPEASDSFWLISTQMRKQMASYIEANPERSFFYIEYSFDRNTSTPTVSNREETRLGPSEVTQFVQVLNTTEIEQGQSRISIPNVFHPVIMLDATKSVQILDARTGASAIEITLHTDSQGGSGLSSWSVQARGTSCKLRSESASEPCPPTFEVADQKIAPGSSAGSDGSSSWSITGLYIGVVYAIGRLLRAAFQGSSQRMIYEELPDTELLLDLCNGIYIARTQNLMDIEFRLYYELVRIFRSPELLQDVSRCKKADFPVPADGGSSAGGGGMAASFPVSPAATSARRQHDEHEPAAQVASGGSESAVAAVPARPRTQRLAPMQASSSKEAGASSGVDGNAPTAGASSLRRRPAPSGGVSPGPRFPMVGSQSASCPFSGGPGDLPRPWLQDDGESRHRSSHVRDI